MHEAWHHFRAGERYSRADVVATCERRIQDGGVIREVGKDRLVELLRRYAPPVIVWSPFSTAWGASPFNPNCWRTIEGEPIIPEGIDMPELSEPDA